MIRGSFLQFYMYLTVFTKRFLIVTDTISFCCFCKNQLDLSYFLTCTSVYSSFCKKIRINFAKKIEVAKVSVQNPFFSRSALHLFSHVLSHLFHSSLNNLDTFIISLIAFIHTFCKFPNLHIYICFFPSVKTQRLRTASKHRLYLRCK